MSDATDASPGGQGDPGTDNPQAPEAVQTTDTGTSVDSLDAQFSGLGFGGKPSSSSNVSAEPAIDPRHTYKMDNPKRGNFIIINNKQFDAKTQMNTRSGTDADAANLYTRFKELGFDVHLYNNLKTSQMMQLFIEAAKLDHSQCDAFGCAILSHGDEGVVYGTDNIVKLDQLFAPLKGDKCKTLLGKPKIMIIQACRGSSLDHGAEATDAHVEEEKTYRIPTEADFLYAYSTVPGFFSWRNSTKGSWFVQALSKVLQEHGSTREIMWLLTRVNHMVAYEFESNAAKEFMNKKKQIPSIVSQLTKELYLTPTSK